MEKHVLSHTHMDSLVHGKSQVSNRNERIQENTIKFVVRQFDNHDMERWNDFVEKSNEGTIFHRLDFLSYHGNRYKQNEHHLVILKKNKLYGIMPMAIFEQEDTLIAKSPYGASYGGAIFSRHQNYHDSSEIIHAILKYLKEQNITKLVITLPTPILYQNYSDTIRLVLVEQGFKCSNRDIVSVVRLEKSNAQSDEMLLRLPNIKRKALKARKHGVHVVKKAPPSDFWQVLEKTFSKLNIEPAHNLAEFQWLNNNFPESVYADVAYISEEPVAAIGYIILNKSVNSSFYLCMDPQKRHTQALSALIYEALDESKQKGFSWFDFGTSSINMKGLANIFRFKESFGAVGIFRETYTWEEDKPSL